MAKSVGSPSQTIALTGVGETLALGFTPASLNLGTVPVGLTSSQSATVTNDSAVKTERAGDLHGHDRVHAARRLYL